MFRKLIVPLSVLALLATVAGGCKPAAPPVPYGGVIKIGHVAPMTGDIPKVGEDGKNGVEMALDEIDWKLKVGPHEYKIEILLEDNESKAESAVAAATKLIKEDRVLALIGSYASKQTIPMGEVADREKTPMISPWSTNPLSTKGRPYVFRACFIDDFQGFVGAKYVKDYFKATKVAVLYDVASDYPKGLAEFFKKSVEELGLEVVAFETFTTKDRDFSAQLTKIIESGADILYTPQYYDEVPLIVRQAKELGWDKPIFGSDSWAGGDLASLCGEDCVGYRFTTHYAMVGATGKTKEFIDAFNEKYGYVPSDVGALAYDAAQILLKAIENTGGLTGELEKDREAIKDQLAKIKKWEGTTGTMDFTPEGDPIKCAVIVEYNPDFEFQFVDWACP
jgi:branched-chain amino acid transport system substrate-binding protein